MCRPSRARFMTTARDAHGPFVVIDCALPDTTKLEQADLQQDGVRRAPWRSSTFDELPAPLQARLARVLRDGQIETMHRGRVWRSTCACIAGVSGEPDDAIQEGTLRRDLRGRDSICGSSCRRCASAPADIPMLIGCLVGDAAATARVPVPTFTREALTLLAALPWRRNFDELREVLDVLVRAVGRRRGARSRTCWITFRSNRSCGARPARRTCARRASASSVTTSRRC